MNEKLIFGILQLMEQTIKHLKTCIKENDSYNLESAKTFFTLIENLSCDAMCIVDDAMTVQSICNCNIEEDIAEGDES